MRKALVLVLMIAAVTLMIWAGVHNGRERRLAMQQGAAPRVINAPSLGHDVDGNGSTPKLQGKDAPAFSLVNLDGKKVSLADFRGKPVVVNFWATWCGPCKIEMPWFQEFSQKYASDGLVVLGLAADEAPKTVIAGTAKKLGVTYPVLLADDKIEDAYGGIDNLPQSFYVDKNGKVVLVTAGISDGQGGKDEVEANIKRLIAGSGV